MASKNRQILMVNQNRIVLLNDLIPKNVTMFEYECTADGRIVLTPFPAEAAYDRNRSKKAAQSEHGHAEPGHGRVIDFQTGRAIREKRRRAKRKTMGAEQSNAKAEGDERFVGLHLFPSRLEAEMVAEILRQADILFLIQSEDIGLFGPSAAPAPGGARLVVRQVDLAAAKTLLSGLI